MKSILRALLVVLGCCLASSLPAAEKGETGLLARAAKLAAEGNDREAADLLKPLLADKTGDARVLAEALSLSVQCTTQLGEEAEAETIIETAAKTHADKWRVLAMAGTTMGRLQHGGTIVDGRFVRGNRQRGNWATSEVRDQVRSLQLLLAARAQIPVTDDAQDRGDVLWDLYQAWAGNSGQPWRLQALTDLKVLPEPEPGYGYRHQSDNGYPVDAEGNPVFFSLPASYETADNDGSRLRFALQEWGAVCPANAVAAKLLLANLAHAWFGVQPVNDLVSGHVEEDAAKPRGGITTVHTLADDETITKLATGPKRFRLPADYAFIPRWREVIEASPEAGKLCGGAFPTTRATAAYQGLVAELLNRHQNDQAAHELKRAIPQEHDKNAKKSFVSQLGQITENWGRIEPAEAQPEGTTAKFPLLFRNATKVSFKARLVDIERLLEDTKNYLKTKPGEMDGYKTNIYGIGERLLQQGGDQYLGETVAQWKTALQPAEHHWDKSASIETPLTKAGAYWLEGTFEGGHVTRGLLWIEGLTIVETKQAAGLHYFVCDASTGAPMPGVKVAFFGYHQQWKEPGLFRKKPYMEYTFKEFQATTDAEGVAKMGQDRLPRDYQWLVTARDGSGRLAFSGFQNHYFYERDADGRGDPSRIYVITDRPVYRSGQEVKWKFWARSAGYDPKLNTNPYAGKNCEVTVTNQRSEKIWDKTYRADDSGAVEDTLKLADDATLGQYRVWISFDKNRGPNGNHAFRVEEYKKPEFEVKVQTPDKPVTLGESFEFKIASDYYFGGAVKEGRVKYKVSRTTHTDRWFPSGPWDWLFGEGYNWRSLTYEWYPGFRQWSFCMPRWPWMNWNSEPPEVMAEGEAAIGADGTIKVRIDTSTAKELHGDSDHRYEIEAEVTDNSRRTIFGKGSVLAARHAFETYAWLDRGWYQTGGAAHLSITGRTLEGKTVAATGRLRVLKLSYDKDGSPHEEEVAVFDVKTLGGEPAAQAIQWPGAGQYRLAVTLKDGDGHESQTSIFTTVRGENLNTHDYRFDDLELITAKDEYQPGDEVELQINTNHVGSTVALFVRAEKHADPVWLHLAEKSTTYHFKLSEADQPNIFLEAYTVSNLDNVSRTPSKVGEIVGEPHGVCLPVATT
ncbi:MAG: alpha-2-macroglobulin domain protein [Verrucomicrobiaceae bacterium]|nr:alpha-2-macroglobulin domain protein [Verrucomicrobiaceae bacterium]